MVEEKTEAVEEVAQVEDLSGKVSELEASLEASKAESKSHQAYGTRTKAELDRQRGLDNEITSLKDQVGVVTEMVAAMMDKEEGETYEAPKKRRSEEYLSRIPKADPQKARNDEFLRVATEADGLAKSAGFVLAEAPEMEKAYLYFQAGKEEQGIEEVKRVIGEKKTEAPEDVDKKVNELVEERLRVEMDKRGYLDSDDGFPSGSSPDWERVREAYIKNPDDHKNTKLYYEMRREQGRYI